MIYEVSPYNNEHIVAKLKIEESATFVDQLHVCEANRTYTFKPKPYNFPFESNPRIYYEKLDADTAFVGRRLRPRRRFPFFSYSVDGWVNEPVQRNFCCSKIKPRDSDLVVLSDIDEIIDSRHWPQIIDEVAKRGIVTVGLHFTLYFLNLFSKSFPGPPDYSYRIFIMTGKIFNTLTVTSDQLRKLGERGKLIDDVYRIPGLMGFHHSWLGDEVFIENKLRSYSHGREDHSAHLYSRYGNIDRAAIRSFLVSKSSIFGEGHELEVRNDVEFLASVTEKRDSELRDFFAP